MWRWRSRRTAFPPLSKACAATSVAGVNVTLPFKEAALAAADAVHPRAQRARAANVLIFDADGRVRADNTDGLGLATAFAEQAPRFDARRGPVVVLGAGGAARGAAAAFVAAGCPQVRHRQPHRWRQCRGRGRRLGEAVGPYPLGRGRSKAFWRRQRGDQRHLRRHRRRQGELDVPLEATPARCGGDGHDLHPAGHAFPGPGPGAQAAHGGWAGDADRPGAAFVRGLLRPDAAAARRARPGARRRWRRADDHHRPHRLHRHGQVHHRGDVPPGRRAGL